MKFLKNIKQKEGAISIMMVVALLIAAVILTGFVDLLKRSYTINEVSSIMDVASVTSLRAGVDEEKLRVEVFEVDQSLVVRNYQKMVTEGITGYGHLDSFKFARTKIESFDENWGLGQTGKSRPQVLLDSTVILRIDSNPLFTAAPAIAERFYEARSNGDFEVSYNRITEEGKIEVAVRSVTRVVYR